MPTSYDAQLPQAMMALGLQTVPSSLKAILFDVDGTLYSQARVRRTVFRKLFCNCVRHPAEGVRSVRLLRAYRAVQEELRNHYAAEAEGQFRLACQRTGVSEQAGRRIVQKWMFTAPLPAIAGAMTPGLREFLDTARSRGIRCGVVSDYAPEDKLAAMGIREQFSVIVSPGAHSVTRFKPAPDGLYAALRTLRVSAAEAIYIGDRQDVDLKAAHQAGMPAVLIGKRRRLHSGVPIARDFCELKKLLFP